MSWEVGFPPNFDPDGDKTSEVLGKHINELDRIYNILTQLFDSVSGHTHDGTINNGPIIPTVTNSTYSTYATNATNATKLATPRNINSISFDGTADITIPTIPVGGIIMWSGSIASIPSGWALCNGQNGTPNLQDRFIVGAGSGYAVGATGGEATHTLTIGEMPSHNHSFKQVTNTDYTTYYGAAPCGSHIGTYYTDNNGGGQPHENRPPYFALAYIMKL